MALPEHTTAGAATRERPISRAAIGLRVIVCGGRDYDDRDHIHNTLCGLHAETPISCVIHGTASGADTEGMIWAQMMGVLHSPFQADWYALGKAAGPIRNQRMLDEGRPDLVLAFPGGRGTADMVRRAKASGVRVVEVGQRSDRAETPAEVSSANKNNPHHREG